MRSKMVLLFGNPKGGGPVMLAAPSAALDLPLRILVRPQLDFAASVSGSETEA